MSVVQSLLVRLFEKVTGTQAKARTVTAVSRFGPYLLGMGVAKGLSTAGQLLVSRWLGPSELGQLAVVLSASTLLASPLAGAWGSTFVRYAAGQARETWAPLLWWTRRRAFFWTGILTLSLVLLSPLLAPVLRVPAALLIGGALLALAMQLWLFAKAACQGREDWRRFIAAELGFGAALAVSSCLLLLFPESRWWQAALAFFAAYVVGSVPGWSLFRGAPPVAADTPSHPPWRSTGAAEYVRFALLTGAANTIFLYSDRFAAQRVLGFAEVGIYQLYNFATIGVAMLLSTLLYNFVFPLFPQGDRRAFARLFRTGFLRLLPLTLTGLFLAGWAQIYLTGFPFRPALLAAATLSAACCIVSGFYGNLVASVGVHGVQLSARVAIASLVLFALGVVPAVRVGGLGGLFGLYTVIQLAVAVFYARMLGRLADDRSADPVVV